MFICSDSGVGLCEDDRILLHSLGRSKSKSGARDNLEKCREIVEKGGNKTDDTEAENNNDMEETNRNITEQGDSTGDSGKNKYLKTFSSFCQTQINQMIQLY